MGNKPSATAAAEPPDDTSEFLLIQRGLWLGPKRTNPLVEPGDLIYQLVYEINIDKK